MRPILFRLFVLLSVLLMPLGMAPAAAAVGDVHHASAAQMPIQHCPDQGTSQDGKGGIVPCSMACGTALPASIALADEPDVAVADPAVPDLSSRLDGLHPEIATPPPRAA